MNSLSCSFMAAKSSVIQADVKINHTEKYDVMILLSYVSLPLGDMRGSHLLKIVDVVHEDAFDLVHRRIDVSRHGNIDEEHGAVPATMHEELPVLGAENRMRSTG